MTNKLQIKILLPPAVNEYNRADFDFQRKIGDGAFGQVWKVRHKKTFKLYAIKQVQKTKVARMIDQFRRELSIMYSLDHPHIVKLYSHFEDEKFFYMLMELVEGGNLFQKLSKENVLLERIAAQYFREIILAVEYLHTRSPIIIHRDIKPENIMIDKSGRMKLSDFGWANYVNRIAERLTSCGTLEYLPPEIVEEQGHDTCADIWCLGILLFEMLAGTTPFKASGKEKTMRNIASGAFKFPIGFSHIAKDLIMRMLAKDKAKRWDIFQVKSHTWLNIMPPIRETMIQNLTPKILSFLDSEKTDEVTTAYSDNDTDEELKVKSENAFKKSVKKLKKNLRNSVIKILSNRSSLKDNCREYFNLCQKEKDLDEKVKEKSREIIKVIGINKELLSKCFDLNLDLERLETQDSVSLTEQIKEMHKRLGELKKTTKLQQLYLENLKSQIKASVQSTVESEKNLKSLQKQLQDLKDSVYYSKQKQKSGIFELSINLDVIRSRIQEKDNIVSNFAGFDRVLGKEISDYIRERMGYLKDFNRDLNRKLEETEEMINEREQQMSELMIEYEMKKSQKLHFLRRKKDEFLRQIRKEREEKRILNVKFNEELRIDLKLKLNEARKNEFYVEQQEIDECNSRIEVLYI